MDSQIWFMTLYDKDEVADLSPDEKRLLKAVIEQETRQRASGDAEGVGNSQGQEASQGNEGTELVP